MTLLSGLGALCVALWLHLIFGRSGFWRADQRLAMPPDRASLSEGGRGNTPLAPTGPSPERGEREGERGVKLPGVVAIVPARNEALTVGACLESLAQQDYEGALSIILVDDASSDGTGERARAVLARQPPHRRGRVVSAPPRAEGWTGKLSALNAGLAAARSFAPDAAYVWLTDADIVHGARTLTALVAKAGEGRDLVSLMVKLHCQSAWERLLIPAFVFFFQMLYPFPAVNERPSRMGGAAGGCMLVKRAALEAIGGLETIKAALIDDCALAETLRRRSFFLWLGLAEESHSLRPYEGLGELWHMVARTAYTQLRYSPALLLGTLVGLVLAFLLPPLLLVALVLHGDGLAAILGTASWTLMAVAYYPTVALYGGGPLLSLTLPVAAGLYAAMTADSARRHWLGVGGVWKERAHNFG